MLYEKKALINSQEPCAIILHVGGTGLGVIRSLGKKGIPIIGLDPKRDVGSFSKYCRYIKCPDPESNEKEFIDFLIRLKYNIKNQCVIFPTTDIDVKVISKNKEKLQDFFIIPLPDFSIVERLVDKEKFYAYIDMLHFPCPKTFSYRDISQFDSFADTLRFPCILKPSNSTIFGRDFGVKLFKAESKNSLLELIRISTSRGHDILIQELIPGDDSKLFGFCSYCNREHKPIAFFMYKKLRGFPQGFGLCTLIESVWIPEILEIGIKFLKKIKYIGISEIEFKLDFRDNTYKIIEVNARTWWENILAERCGVDLSYICYCDSILKPISYDFSPELGVKWIYIIDDLRALASGLARGNISIISYIKSIRGKKIYAIISIDDPLPTVIFPMLIGKRFINYIRKPKIKNISYQTQ